MKYCDSKELERNWFFWLLASSTPVLEPFRKAGLLWTKPLGEVCDNDGKPVGKQPIPDPGYPIRAHRITSEPQLYFNSYDGKPSARATTFLNGTPTSVTLDLDAVNLLAKGVIDTTKLIRTGYVQELPYDTTWHLMLSDITKICHGISMKFNLLNEDERDDLACSALLQVANKLVNKKLIYTPGRAPVFNLLTTTIHRIMFSILNRNNKQRSNINRLAVDLQAGVLPDNMRSLRVPLKHIAH